MEKILSYSLSTGYNFMTEMHLNQAWFAYIACKPFIKINERIQKFKEIGNSKCIYQNNLHKAYFQHHMVYGDFKDLPRGKASDKVFNDDKYPKYWGYQSVISSIVQENLIKSATMNTNKSTGFNTPVNAIKSGTMSSQQLAEILHISVIKNITFKMYKIYHFSKIIFKLQI